MNFIDNLNENLTADSIKKMLDIVTKDKKPSLKHARTQLLPFRFREHSVHDKKKRNG